jgi:hypothetical protein
MLIGLGAIAASFGLAGLVSPRIALVLAIAAVILVVCFTIELVSVRRKLRSRLEDKKYLNTNHPPAEGWGVL